MRNIHTFVLASSLIGHYRQVVELLEEAEVYFEKLTESVSMDDTEKWSKEINEAEIQRFQTPAAMDIMGTRNVAVEKDNISTVVDQEKFAPVVVWISLALTVEEKQCVKCFVI